MKKYVNGEYIEMTQEEIEQMWNETSQIDKEAQIQDLKERLSTSDYKAIKYAEGWISDEDYAPVKAERQAIRDEINRLEQEV